MALKGAERAKAKDVDTGSGALHGLFVVAASLLGLVAWALLSLGQRASVAYCPA